MSWFEFTIVLCIVMWMILCVSMIHVFQLVKQHKTVDEEKTPTVIHVRAMLVLDDPLQFTRIMSKTRNIVDGVNIRHKDTVLIWSRTSSSIWEYRHKTWHPKGTLLADAVVSSMIQVVDGLEFAHTTWVVRKHRQLVPLWQHWLLIPEDMERALTYNDTHELVSNKEGTRLCFDRPS